MGFWTWLKSWGRNKDAPVVSTIAPSDGTARTHLIILDGTRSSLNEGWETNAGLAYKLLKPSMNAGFFISYFPGIQFSRDTWGSMFDVLTGRGINNQIRTAYGVVASRYRPGDKIYLMGFSRGAYAARSLAGIIDRVGLLDQKHATYRLVRQAFRHYKTDPDTAVARAFSDQYCHSETCVCAIGVWDTVKALGVRLPLIWRAFDGQYRFHSHRIPACVDYGFHALALDETRSAYAPVMWETRADWPGELVQMWFRGNHSDVGGHLLGRSQSRGLSNISFVWMMQQMEHAGLMLPENWQSDYPTDPNGPTVGNWMGWQKLFLARARRPVGRDVSEQVHETVDPKRHKNLRDFHDYTGG